MLDPDNLRKIAQAATPGPWESMGRFIETKEWVEGQDGDIVSPEVECMAYCYGGSARGIGNPADAEFIATFNPETVLALLDRVEKAERRIERLKNREQKAFEKLRESKAAIARVREVFPGADDPCLPKSCTHVDCEVMNALEGDE